MLKAIVFVLVLCAGSLARAQCVIMPLQQHLTDNHTAALFSATVLDVETVAAGQVLTVNVQRVWKGEVPRRIRLYNFHRTDIQEGRIDLNAGETYLVIAHLQSGAERAAFGLPASGADTLGTSNCLVYRFRGDYTRQTLGDAPGYAPR